MPELNDPVDRDIFAISTDSNPSEELPHKEGLIELNNVDPEKDFKQICESNKDNNVHWLRKVGSSRFLHVKSVGSLCNLRKIVKVGKIKGKCPLIQRRLAIVTGEPGSGKSREFDKLCEQLKREKPHLWAIRINLFDCSSELSKVDSNPEDLDKSLSSVVEFLLKIGQLNDKFAQDLFKHNLLQKDKVAFLFDGFDEVRSSCKAKALELLKFLRGLSGVANLYVSSRPHEKGELEDILGIFACELKPLLMKDQKKILRFLFTKETIESANVSKERVRTLVDELLDSCSQDLDKKFILGNPLGLEILAKFFEKKLQESSIEAYDFNYHDLLEYYIGYKIHLYTEKIGLSVQGNSLRTILDRDKLTLGSNNADELSKSRTFREAIKQHESFKRRFAALFLKDLFGDETYLSICGEKEEDQEDLRMIGHLHLSILEYHIARFFADEYLRDSDGKASKFFDSLKKCYFHPNGKGMRYFFDLIMSKDCPLHVNVINGNYDQIKEIIESKDADRTKKLLEFDGQGRSVLHLVREEALPNFLNAFKKELKLSSSCDYIFYDACVSKDKIFGYTPLDYAIRSGDYKVANQILRLRVLVEKSDVNSLKENRLWLETYQHTLNIDCFKVCNSILFMAIKNKLFYLSSYLMAISSPDQLTKEDHCGRQPLYYILDYEKLTSWKGKNMFSYISKKIDLNTPDNYGQVAGHFFANMLLQLEGDLVDELKYRNDYRVLLSIIRKKANMNVFDKNGNSPLHLAIDKLNVVKLLVEEFSADVNKHCDGKSILHAAISRENLEVIKYLYFKGACLDQKDSYGNTPLHLAVRGESQHTLEIVKFLVEGGANFESEKNRGNTPKDIASGSVLEYLNNLPKYRKYLEGRTDYLLSELRIKISNLLRTQGTIYDLLKELKKQMENMCYIIDKELMGIKRKRVEEAMQGDLYIEAENLGDSMIKEDLSLKYIGKELDVCKEEVLKSCESYEKLLEEMGAADENLKQDKIFLKRMLQQKGEQIILQNLLPILDKEFDYKKLTEMSKYSFYPSRIVVKIIEMNKEATKMRSISMMFLVGSERSRCDKKAQKIEGEIQSSISETIKFVSEASNFLLEIINEYRGYLKKIEENSISFTIQSKNNFSIESILSGDRSKAEDTDSSHHRCRKRKLNGSYCIDKRKEGTRVQQCIPTYLPFLHSNFQYMPQPHEFQIAGYNSSNYDPSQKPQFQQGIPSTSSSTLEHNMLPLYQYPMRNLSQQSTFLLSPTSSMVFNDPGQQRQNYASQSENQFLRAIGNPRTCLSSATIVSVQGCGRDKK